MIIVVSHAIPPAGWTAQWTERDLGKCPCICRPDQERDQQSCPLEPTMLYFHAVNVTRLKTKVAAYFQAATPDIFRNFCGLGL